MADERKFALPDSMQFRAFYAQKRRRSRNSNIPIVVPITRTFIDLDPIANAYYEIAAPITFAGDFEVDVEFSTTLSNAGNVILGNTNNINSAIFVDQFENHRIKTRINNVSIIGTTTVNDGLLHKVKIARVGTTFKLYVDGSLEGTTTVTTSNVLFDLIGRYTGNTHFFDGIIANAKFTDKSGASDVVTTFRLDNSPAAANYTYSTELLDNNTFPDNANARQYLVSSKGWIITDGGAA